MHDFPRLRVWQRAREFAVLIASDLGHMNPEVRERYLGELETIQRMLAKLIASLP
jgi:hypothetical protein